MGKTLDLAHVQKMKDGKALKRFERFACNYAMLPDVKHFKFYIGNDFYFCRVEQQEVTVFRLVKGDGQIGEEHEIGKFTVKR